MQPIFTVIAGVALIYAGGTYFDRGSERRAMRRRGVSLMVAGFFAILAAVAVVTVPH